MGPSFGGKGVRLLLLLCFFLWGRSMKSKKDSGWKWAASLFEGSCDSMMIISDFRLFFFSVYTRMSQ